MSEEAKKPAGKKKLALDPKLAAYRGIWVFIEHERGNAHSVSWELLGEARKLADQLGVQVAGVVMGAPGEATRGFCQEAFHYGADHCYLMKDPLLKDYRNQPFTKGLTDLVNAYQPEILLLGATTLGRDLAGSV
ncbi:MAG TPA: electron transfer flavoprotein subunit alpha, partial [Gallionella sp.]|nr:electron transfer flavoprotein subunit alpha [Gallionella sp.]